MNVYEKWPMAANDDFVIRKPELSDVRSDYEEEKAPIYAVERIKALEVQGYTKSSQKIVGHDGTVYGDYWEKEVG